MIRREEKGRKVKKEEKRKLTKSKIPPVQPSEQHDLLARAHERRVPEVGLVHAGGGGKGGLETVDEEEELVGAAQALSSLASTLPNPPASGEPPDGPQAHGQVEQELEEGEEGEEGRGARRRPREELVPVRREVPRPQLRQAVQRRAGRGPQRRWVQGDEVHALFIGMVVSVLV